MQLNTQLDDSYQAKIVAIQQSTHLETSEIIKQALDLMYQKVALTPKEKNQRLIEMLAGTAEGTEDLSENYKNYLDEGWKGKYDIS